ncbi:MAG: hypothetical protein M9914_14255 [Trueperaceae bacterium]|nr:hypothetical protein [Trueperaceae bacterium]MCO5175338.1 hypothetical protein [Trueperaceae bacterium]
MPLSFETRVAACGLIGDQGRVLLAHISVPGLEPDRTLPGGGPGEPPLHSFRLIYAARFVSGVLRSEAEGSTDEARWFELDEVADLQRVPLVDTGLRLWRERRGGHAR